MHSKLSKSQKLSLIDLVNQTNMYLVHFDVSTESSSRARKLFAWLMALSAIPLLGHNSVITWHMSV